jgi:hypothetical protein
MHQTWFQSYIWGVLETFTNPIHFFQKFFYVIYPLNFVQITQNSKKNEKETRERERRKKNSEKLV